MSMSIEVARREGRGGRGGRGEGHVLIKRANDPASLERLRNEHTTLLAVEGRARAVKAIEWADQGHTGRLTLELVENAQDLDEMALQLDLADRVAVCADACAAVASLHDTGYVHDAIEPSHLLVAEAGDVVLCSLGAAKATTAAESRRRDVAALAAVVRSLCARPDEARSVDHALLAATVERRLDDLVRTGAGCHELADALWAIHDETLATSGTATIRDPNPVAPSTMRIDPADPIEPLAHVPSGSGTDDEASRRPTGISPPMLRRNSSAQAPDGTRTWRLQAQPMDALDRRGAERREATQTDKADRRRAVAAGLVVLSCAVLSWTATRAVVHPPENPRAVLNAPSGPNTPPTPNAPSDPNTPPAPNAPSDPNTPPAPNAPSDPNTPPAPSAPSDPNTPPAPNAPSGPTELIDSGP